MRQAVKFNVALIAFLAVCLKSVESVACFGCADLDELNFDKTVKRFPYALVKFDIAFPYGNKHDAYAEFASSAHRATDELLIATVGIKDYGEMENRELGRRFGFTDKNLPGIVLFKEGNLKQPLVFPSHWFVTSANLQQFINENTQLYIGCDGCLKEFNLAIKNYANLADEQQLQVLRRLEQLQGGLKQPHELYNAKVYIAFAQKINEQGYDFVDQETKRLLRVKAGQVSAEKKKELQRKLNVLDQFRVGKLEKTSKKQEL